MDGDALIEIDEIAQALAGMDAHEYGSVLRARYEERFQFPLAAAFLVLLAGLQGSGKTTTAAKLASRLLKQGRKPFLVPADVYRPAAIEQLHVLGEQLDVPVFNSSMNRAALVIGSTSPISESAVMTGIGATATSVATAEAIPITLPWSSIIGPPLLPRYIEVST